MTSHIDPELEAAYDTARTTPAGSGPYVARFAEASAAARLACAHRTVRYGDRPAEAIDLFRAAAGSPLLVFIHGGYWRRMTRADFSFVAPPLARAGVSVAIVGYPLAPEVDLDTIVAAVCRGTEVAVAAAAGDGMDVARLTLAGHSVGAQLAAMVAVRLDVRALVGLSGLYDLAPLRDVDQRRDRDDARGGGAQRPARAPPGSGANVRRRRRRPRIRRVPRADGAICSRLGAMGRIGHPGRRPGGGPLLARACARRSGAVAHANRRAGRSGRLTRERLRDHRRTLAAIHLDADVADVRLNRRLADPQAVRDVDRA